MQGESTRNSVKPFEVRWMAGSPDLPYLKKVSRVKHVILENYLQPWSWILGSAHRRLGYFDCFAGGGLYTDETGNQLPGSPLIALRWATRYAAKYTERSLVLGFVEEDAETAERLRQSLARETDVPPSVKYNVYEEDANDFVARLINGIKQAGPYRQIIPSFFFIDPFGHPLSVPVMRDLLALGKTEILVNLMMFRIHMHLHNPVLQPSIDRLFGHDRWRAERFMLLDGRDDELAFVDYFREQVGAKYSLPFLVHYSPENGVAGAGNRTKFYLIHFSNHSKAAVRMKETMARASDSIGGLEFSGRDREYYQPSLLFGQAQLENDLLERFKGREVRFEDVQAETLEWPYVEKDYRGAIKSLEKQGRLSVRRVKPTAKTGLADEDRVVFP